MAVWLAETYEGWLTSGVPVLRHLSHSMRHQVDCAPRTPALYWRSLGLTVIHREKDTPSRASDVDHVMRPIVAGATAEGGAVCGA